MSNETRLQRARRDTRISVPREIGVAVIAAVLAWYLLPNEQAMEEVTAIAIAAIAAAVIWPCAEFAWNWLRAPLRIANDQISRLEDQNAALQARIDDMSKLNLDNWTPLTASQQNELFKRLSDNKHYSIYIARVGSEGVELANTFHDVFNRLQWPVQRGTGFMDAQGCEGIALTPCEDPAPLLRSAIESATDFTVDVFQISREQAGYDFDTMLIIGAKPWRAANT